VSTPDASRQGPAAPAAAPVTPTTPPPDADEPRRHAEAPPPGTLLGQHYPMCFACGDQQPDGLHLKVTAGEGVSVSAEFEVGTGHQGAPGLIHGGMLTLAFDEVIGSVQQLLRTPAVTGRLETDFLRPIPVGRTVHISARCVGVRGRKLYHVAEGRLDAPDGELVARAAALFVQVGLEHFTKHGRAEEVRQVIDDPETFRTLHAFEVNP
jgi:acyl-coenzyme A thioesterase PaaI-like protein